MRTISIAAIALLASIAGLSALAASYKCKDANGAWTEAACTGAAAPPPAPALAADISDWRPRVGMKKSEVEAVLLQSIEENKKVDFPTRLRQIDEGKIKYNPWLGSWPSKNRTETSRGVREQWVFGSSYSDRHYLYFENDVLTTIQE